MRSPGSLLVLGMVGLLAATAGAGQDAAKAASPDGPAPQGVASKRTSTYGTTQTSYARVGVTEFVPLDSSMTYTDLGLTSSTLSRYPTNANGFGVFAATVHLPSGALVDAVEFDWCDSNNGADLTLEVLSSSYTGQNFVLLNSTTSFGFVGCGFTVVGLAPFQIDNDLNQLLLYVIVPTQDGTTSISGAILRYRLQVSPAPGTPSFGDVPATDFGYQYVEALAASGITGGCGGGNYCPDANLTRRQMAIFLAKALGLHFQ